MDVILASQSPRRAELLKNIFEDFRIIPANIEEIVPSYIQTEQFAQYLAQQKASHVAAQHPRSLIIAADTIVAAGGDILGKPSDPADAWRMLERLSGGWHSVYTGVSVALGDFSGSFCCKSDVAFYPLDDGEITRYVATGEPFDKAGAYGIQGGAGIFVREIRGDYFNIMGLPVSMLYHYLKEHKIFS